MLKQNYARTCRLKLEQTEYKVVLKAATRVNETKETVVFGARFSLTYCYCRFPGSSGLNAELKSLDRVNYDKSID